nr:DUF4878 domain-containing protein [uncultured Aminipila sp.]
MKKKLSLLLVLVLCFTLFSCVKQPTPTDVANSYLSAIKSNDTEQLTKLYAGDISTVSFQAAYDDMSDSFSKELAKNLTTKFTSFEYKISNEIIKDDKATVDVTIKTYNLGDAFKSAISEYITEGISLAISGTSEEEINKLLEDKLSKKINEATFDYESTTPLSLTKTEDGWIIDEYSNDSEFLNALTGGIIDTSNDMAESFGDSETE